MSLGVRLGVSFRTPIRMLTTVRIKSAKPQSRAYKITDSGGLYLLVHTNGAKLWRYKFRIGGTEGLLAIGAFPEVGLADARAAHVAARRMVAQGINPVQAKRQRKEDLVHAQLVREKGSFSAVLADWSDATAAGLSTSTKKQRDREIGNDLLPRLGTRSIISISRVEITALLKAVEQRAPEVARNLRNYLWSVFEYAIDTGLLENNQVPPVRTLKRRHQKNHPALSKGQVGGLLRKLADASLMTMPTRVAMELVILTAARKCEVIEGCWSEIDLEAAEWEIPAVRMKARRSHWIPLSRQAVALLKEWREVTPRGQKFLFPNRRDPQRPMANRSLNAVMDRLGYGGVGTPHGMRSVFSTHFNSLGANADVIECCLAHVPLNRTRAAYNRHQYENERRELLQQWADELDKLRDEQ